MQKYPFISSVEAEKMLPLNFGRNTKYSHNEEAMLTQ